MAEWVSIQTFLYPQDAYIVKGLLESEGIDAFLKDEMTTQVFNFYSNAIGGVKLLVPEEQADKAREILKKNGYTIDSENPEEDIELISKSETTDKNCCPFCGSSNISQQKKASIVTIVLIFLLGLLLPITKKSYVCFDCNKKWRFK
jgi:hypothetical protein